MTRKGFKDDVAVYSMSAETGEHKFVFDFAALDRVEAEAFARGKMAGIAEVKQLRGDEALKQIDRMARQIEESHAALRRRAGDIAKLTKRIAELEAEVLAAKQQTEGDARAEAWHEGWKHDSAYQFEFGQFCPHSDCNPYRKAGNSCK